MVFSEFGNEHRKAFRQRLLAGLSLAVEFSAKHVMQKFAAFSLQFGRIAEAHAERHV